jgi:hypothetical protein
MKADRDESRMNRPSAACNSLRLLRFDGVSQFGSLQVEHLQKYRVGGLERDSQLHLTVESEHRAER